MLLETDCTYVWGDAKPRGACSSDAHLAFCLTRAKEEVHDDVERCWQSKASMQILVQDTCLQHFICNLLTG